MDQNNKYNENEALKEYMNSKRQYPSQALTQMEKNLSNYFESPYNELQSFLENNDSVPRMNTKESNDSFTQKVFDQNLLSFRTCSTLGTVQVMKSLI